MHSSGTFMHASCITESVRVAAEAPTRTSEAMVPQRVESRHSEGGCSEKSRLLRQERRGGGGRGCKAMGSILPRALHSSIASKLVGGRERMSFEREVR